MTSRDQILGNVPDPDLQVIIRSEGVLQLFQSEIVTDTIERISRSFLVSPFRKFLLYLSILSTSTPTDLRVKVQFLNPVTGRWHTYKQGPFASLYYEDQDTATRQDECFSGDCAGREIRITLTGSGTTSAAYFAVNAHLELYS